MADACKHDSGKLPKITMRLRFVRMPDVNLSRRLMFLRMQCTDCGEPIRFFGGFGINTEETTVSDDMTEIRIPYTYVRMEEDAEKEA